MPQLNLSLIPNVKQSLRSQSTPGIYLPATTVVAGVAIGNCPTTLDFFLLMLALLEVLLSETEDLRRPGPAGPDGG
jgi:hypothetical protein